VFWILKLKLFHLIIITVIILKTQYFDSAPKNRDTSWTLFWNLLYKFTCSVCLSVRRQFCTDTAFSRAEPAGGGETHAGRTGLFYGRTRRWPLSVCRGPETQIPTNILIHLWSNIFVLGTYWNLFWKNGDFFFFFWPWKCGHFVTFFFTKIICMSHT
jgi:hypothetical protein